ncbi:hypothetical protein EXE53_18230 [Halorubrum sp. SD626R]|uniref:hypothetical protein n=1 Tax=Halorubrum sp. SD626R TaxID=1419722 RepID=UPI0010FA1719|nr:hypothetical protein [Halorubrum sp. SD626R]TKX79000.1 hypothetical protein EXE53_18230 [Halorubrum sp. SD626R]
MIPTVLNGLGAVLAIVFFIAWSRENQKRRDVEHDLQAAIVRGQVTSHDLRRSLCYKSVRQKCERQDPKDRARYNNDRRSRGGDDA